VSMKGKNSGDHIEPIVKRTVHSYDEANCKDPRIAKHMRPAW